MVKMVIFFKRKPGISVEDFQKYWRTTHADIIVRLPGIRRYIQSPVLASAYRKGEPVCDAVAESYFDDTQAMKALSKMPEYAKVLADEPNFIEGPSMASIITDEYVIKDAPAPQNAVKSMTGAGAASAHTDPKIQTTLRQRTQDSYGRALLAL